MLKYIRQENVLDLNTNLSIALHSLLTGEMNFSCLKLVENYLQSTVSPHYLDGLAKISTENQICPELDSSLLNKVFTAAKARMVLFQMVSQQY